MRNYSQSLGGRPRASQVENSAEVYLTNLTTRSEQNRFLDEGEIVRKIAIYDAVYFTGAAHRRQTAVERSRTRTRREKLLKKSIPENFRCLVIDRLANPSKCSTMMYKTAFVCAALFALFHTGASLRCYMGAGQTSNSVNCQGSCMKTIGSYDDDSGVAKACSPIHFKDGCHETTVLVHIETCYCNSDYCNAAPGALRAASWTMALSALALALRGALF
ncbi:uncharacterized protein LOC122265995 isoform X2 [Penaeus japonicus]|uniref:uncharacterized protein LOC122265995 isoform X2 n=1 Tax=Penaeus japonicus TaxID=27405 RepID=UPI001C711BF8|nr:uncharacterized protein LOC122265995 isoform X2 [Penaeus japonicus]